MEKDMIKGRRSEPTTAIITQVKDVTLPTTEEQMDMIARIQQGSKEAEEELKRANIRFVASLAKQYLDMGISDDELLSAGMEGFVVAGHRYDASRGLKFVTYAIWWVRQAILNALQDSGNEEGKKVWQKEKERVAKNEAFTHLLESGHLTEDVASAIEALEPQSKQIILLTYGIDCDKCTDEEICEKLGLTKPSLLQIKCIAIIKLRRKCVKYDSPGIE